MHVSAALLANQAAVGADGLLNVAGAGWEYIQAPGPVFTLNGYVAGIIEFGDDELPAARMVQLAVEDEVGADAGYRGSFAIVTSRRLAPFAIPFTVGVFELPEGAARRFVLSDEDGGPLYETRLPVRPPLVDEA